MSKLGGRPILLANPYRDESGRFSGAARAAKTLFRVATKPHRAAGKLIGKRAKATGGLVKKGAKAAYKGGRAVQRAAWKHKKKIAVGAGIAAGVGVAAYAAKKGQRTRKTAKAQKQWYAGLAGVKPKSKSGLGSRAKAKVGGFKRQRAARATVKRLLKQRPSYKR